MAFKLMSTANHPIAISLDATNSVHMSAFDQGQVIDDKYRNVPDILSGLRTGILRIQQIHEDVEPEVVAPKELTEPEKGGKK